MNPICHVRVGENILPTTDGKENGAAERLSLQVSCIPVIMQRRRFEEMASREWSYHFGDWPGSHDSIASSYEGEYVDQTRSPELFLPIAAGSWNGRGMEVLGLTVAPSGGYTGAFGRVGVWKYKFKNKEKRKEREKVKQYNSGSFSYLNDLTLRKMIVLV